MKRKTTLSNEFAISEFKARALEILKLVHDSGQTITVTKHNVPLVQVVPIQVTTKQKLDALSHTVLFVGDIESPAIPLEDWEMLK